MFNPKGILHNDWNDLLSPAFETDSYQRLRAFLMTEYRTQRIHPDMYDIYNALHWTPFHAVKAVILGQDPYHGEHQAHGLSFSVMRPTLPPPSLINIYKELNSDLSLPIPNHGCLTSWARQGVLLLNTVLTVRHGVANSHRGKGWEEFTDSVIDCLNAKETPIVFILWGRNAREKRARLTNPIHCVLEAPHPSPLSAHNGFFGSRPFSQTNAFLISKGLEPIDWRIPEEPVDMPKYIL